MFLDFNAARPTLRSKPPEAVTQAIPEEGASPGNRPPGFTTFATSEEGKTPRPLPPDTATTLALGEEGGSLPTPMPLPRDPYPSPGLTTFATGEEGGSLPTPMPLPRDPYPSPGITTQAIGEEGGQYPPMPSTRALGEEGGGYPPIPPSGGNSISTNVAQQVLGEADGMNRPYLLSNGIDNLIRSPIAPNYQKDGQLTREELSAYVDQLRNTRFIQAPGPEFDNKLKAAEFMLNNFDELASASGSPRPPIYYDEAQGNSTEPAALFRRPYPFPGNNQTIDARDLSVASRRDGRPENISQRDLNQQVATYAFWETGFPPMPEPLPGGGGVSKVWLEGGFAI